jgi:acylphosphatase
MAFKDVLRLDIVPRRPDNALMLVCKHVRFSGRVQGVGFRQTARSIASGYAVVGYVRNLPQGDVEMVVQGEHPEVESMLAAVSQRMEHYIRQRVERDEPSGQYGEFDIRF